MDKKIDEYLTLMYQLVKQEVSQADSKLGWRISFIGIFISAITALAIWGRDNTIIFWTSLAFISVFTISLFIAVCGLYPKFKTKGMKENSGKRKMKNENDSNIYFFKWIAQTNLEKYKESLKNRFGSSLSDIQLELVEQIHINSQIALRKYKLYIYSWWFLITLHNICRIFWKLIISIFGKK